MWPAGKCWAQISFPRGRPLGPTWERIVSLEIRLAVRSIQWLNNCPNLRKPVSIGFPWRIGRPMQMAKENRPGLSAAGVIGSKTFFICIELETAGRGIIYW